MHEAGAEDKCPRNMIDKVLPVPRIEEPAPNLHQDIFRFMMREAHLGSLWGDQSSLTRIDMVLNQSVVQFYLLHL